MRNLHFRTLLLAWLPVLPLALSALGCSGDGAIVGAECKSGYTQCNDTCVDTSSDPANCGGCGLTCGPQHVCQDGLCIGPDGDASTPDGASNADGSDSASNADGSDGASSDDGSDGASSDDGQTEQDASDDATPADGSDNDAFGADGGGDESVPEDAQASDSTDGPPVDNDGGVLDGSDDASQAQDALAADGAGASDGIDDDAVLSDGALNDDGASTDGRINEPDADPGSDASSSEDAQAEDPDAGEDASTDIQAPDLCVPPYDNVLNCGACGVACSEPTPRCKDDGAGSFACAPFCDLGLQRCGSMCKDLQNDTDNCGSCGHRCLSGLCQAGECRGKAVGHVVIIGMSYRSWLADSPPSRVLANAAFLPPANPVRMLEYAEYADRSTNGSYSKVAGVLSWASGDTGRGLNVSSLPTWTALSSELSIDEHDVLLIHDQSEAPEDELQRAGDAWGPTLTTYVQSGGVVVVLMSAQGRNDMPSLIRRSGLADITALVPATYSVLLNNAPADAVGVNVLSPFLARPDTVTAVTSLVPDLLTSFVVVRQTADAADPLEPVVIHRVVPP